MARIYQTRTLLDPSHLQILNQRQAQMYNEDAQRRKNVLDAFNNMTSQLGQAGTELYGRYSRSKLLGDYEQNNDPMYRAAADKFIQSGDPSSMINYQMQRDAAAARQAAAQQAADDKRLQTEWHDNVQFGTDQANVAKLNAQMLESLDKGDLVNANAIQKQIEAYENKWKDKNRTFGDTAADIKRAYQEQQEMKAEEEMGMRNLKAVQEANENDRQYEVSKFLTTIPKTFAKEADKEKYYKQIQENEFMTNAEKAKGMDSLRAIDSGSTLSKKSVQNAVASASGEQTKQNIQDTKDKNAAQGYVGQKMNSLQFMQLPENVRKHLTRNGQGIVSMR